jgi:Icc protein
VKKNTIRFIHISDTHIGESKDFTLYGKNTFNCTNKLLKLISVFNSPFDFVVHTGDIVNSPQNSAISLARKLFRTVDYPVYFITGNHDNSNVIKKIQTDASHCSQSSDLLYSFSVNQYQFVFLNLKGAGEGDNHGIFSREDTDILYNHILDNTSFEIIVFIHFPPLQLDCTWVDNEMTLLNNKRFLEIIHHSPAKIRAVFYGHIHNPTCINHGGVIYSSAPSPFCQFRIFASDNEVRFNPDIPVSFNYITVNDNDIIVKTVSETDISIRQK